MVGRWRCVLEGNGEREQLGGEPSPQPSDEASKPAVQIDLRHVLCPLGASHGAANALPSKRIVITR